MCLNADMLTNKLPELELLSREHSPDIIGVNEVLPKSYKNKIYPEEFHIDGYEMIPHRNVSENKGRGSILYIREGMINKELHLDKDDYFEENIIVEIPLTGNDKLICALIYRRGKSSVQNNKNMMKLLNKLSTLNPSHLLIMGDMNLSEIDWINQRCKTNNDEDINHKFLECMRDCYLFQHVLEPTRQRGQNEPSTLDLIFTNEEHMISIIEHLAPLGKSDHSILKFEMNCGVGKKPPKIVSQINKGNYDKMRDIFKSTDWENELRNNADVNELWEKFSEIYYSVEKECVPTKTVYVDGKKSKRLSMPLDKKSLRKIKKKNKLWSSVRSKLASTEKELQYNKLRNQVRKLTRKAKKLTEKNIAKNAKKNPKGFWKYSQSKLKTKAGIPDLEVNDDNDKKAYATDDKSKSNLFQDYFGGVFTEEPDGELPHFEERKYENMISSIEITEDMILKKLKKIKINKSPGPDTIHPRVIHEISNEICKPLCIIFQASIKSKKLPDEWKHAHVTAIYKKGAKTKPQNYRPVSLTSVVCKLMEGIVRDHITDHMTTNNLFSDKQFGFIGGRSTTLQLIYVLSIWTEILDQGGELDAIYCDFMKAFDKVPHRRLVHKIEKYGIKNDILGWINNFLSDRTQTVKVGSSLSRTAKVTSGIPQGSVLGPTLFVIYINDLPEVVEKGSFVYLFADDTKIFREIKSDQDRIILQQDINKLVKWSEIWLLKFHPDKCVYMNVSTNQENNIGEYSMGINTLQESKCEKDIGVHIDNNLKFDIHINNAVNKANRVLAVTRRTFEYMNDEIFCMLFKGVVRPHLEYAAPVWSPHHDKYINQIENVQRRATKLVPGLSKYDYPVRLKKLKLPTLAYRRARGDMIQVYKITTPNKDSYDKSLPPVFIKPNNGLRGHSQKLSLPRPKKDIRKYNFTNRVIEAWNDLPDYVINSKDIKIFEKKLDTYWSDRTIKYDNHLADITQKTTDIYVKYR